MAAVDAHHHLWNYDPVEYGWIGEEMKALRRDYTPDDLWREMGAANVQGAIAVQARQTLRETQWLLDLASTREYMLGVVGWVPLVDRDVAVHLERFAAFPKLRAVRHVLQDEPDPNYMLRADFHQGIRRLREHGLGYDILIHERHLPQAIQLVDANPHQTFILDHLAKPRIKDGALSPWRESLRELSRRQHVFCKLSGMATEADWNSWTGEQLAPYFEVALEAFTPSRLMFASDWPVLEAAGKYGHWVSVVRGWIARLSRDEQESILRKTALRAYRI
ncbi:MAG: amidohydrolase family protein [Acidobacteria bacterium]|nr:amidohydrolase family protein [Acidobacteriota bacterium]